MSRFALPLNSCFLKRSTAALAAAFLAGCEPADQSTEQAAVESGPPALCQAAHTPINEIQGRQYQSPMAGQIVSTRGTVTRVEPGEGVYIEDATLEAKKTQSRALFLADTVIAQQAQAGHLVVAQGQVEERGNNRDTLTSLAAITDWGVCDESAELPLTEIQLPLRPKVREALEGMRLFNDQSLTVTGTYDLDKGLLRLSHEGPLRKPTDLVKPGRSSARLFSRNMERSFDVALSEPPSGTISVGATGSEITGVLGHNGRYPLLHVQQMELSEVEPEPAPTHPEGQTIRVVSINLENFFNGDGLGGGFPAERGPASAAEYQVKASRIEAAIEQLQPDLLAVQELENDGFGPHSAAANLLEMLNRSTTAQWRAVQPETPQVGTDVIAVGLFYKADRLLAQGAPQLLDSAPFQGLSRQPMAQLFSIGTDGEKFLISVNHLKSKGGCPDEGPDTNKLDGQGCWNQARTAAVESQVPWLENLAGDAGTENILVVGDMNAYRLEDPISAFRSAGLIDLVLQNSGRDSYSYVYRGELGTLDYALASPSLVKKAQLAQNWNINAGWPRHVQLQPPWLRFSDHDPVVVDLDFSQ